MLQSLSSIPSFNNDRTAALAAFRLPGHTPPQSPTALALGPSTTPLGTLSTDAEAQTSLVAVRQEMDSQGPSALTQAHSGLDAARVARLLGLLD